MKTLKVLTNNAELDVSFKLARFITDWPIAQTKFITGMAERLRGSQPVLPRDFTMTSSTSLGEARCQLSLFQGACSVVLEAEALKLSFRHATRNYYPTLFGVINLCAEWLVSDLDDHGLEWMFFNSREHVQASIEDGIGDVETYLDQFALKDVAATMQTKSGVRYAPAARITLSDESGHWVLRRTVEKSEWITNGGLFVDTSVHFLSPNLTRFKDTMTILSDLDGLADEAIALQYESQS